MGESGRCYVERPGMNNDAFISYASITLLTTIARHRCQGGKLRDLSFIGRISQSNSPGSELHLTSLESTMTSGPSLAHAFAIQQHEFQRSVRVTTSARKARDLEKIVDRDEL